MNPDRLHQWLQLLGAASIVASLIFVGLQLKQSQEIAIASQYQARHDASAAHMFFLTDSDLKLKLLGERFQANDAVNSSIPEEIKAWINNQPAEKHAFDVVSAYLSLKMLDNLHFQYQAGFLDEESWQGFRLEYMGEIDRPVIGVDMRGIYESNPAIWRATFREMIEEMIAEVDAESN